MSVHHDTFHKFDPVSFSNSTKCSCPLSDPDEFNTLPWKDSASPGPSKAQEIYDEIEVENIKKSIERLREQRMAVEILRNHSSLKEQEAVMLEHELASSRRRINSLEREAVKESNMRDELECLKEKLTLTEQDLQNNTSTLKVVESENRSLQALLEGERAKNKVLSLEHETEVRYLKNVLRDAKEAIQSLKGSIDDHDVLSATIKRVNREKESLAHQNGILSSRIEDMTSTSTKQRAALQHAEMLLEEAKTDIKGLCDERSSLQFQIRNVRSEMIAAHARTAGKDAETISRLRKDLSAAIKKSNESAVELQTLKQICASKDKDLAIYKQSAERLERAKIDIFKLRKRLEKERTERDRWAQTRGELINQFCHEGDILEELLGIREISPTCEENSITSKESFGNETRGSNFFKISKSR